MKNTNPAIPNRCTYPDCCNSRRTRGLCHGHYQVMRSRVRALECTIGGNAGKLLEADLERRGLLLPKGTGGSPATDTLRAFEMGSSIQGTC